MTTASLPITTSQTVGPFFHDCLLRADAHIATLVTPETAGERVRIEGRVLDGDGAGLPDAMLEIWQANSYGRYNHPADTRDLPLDPAFTGHGRTATDAEGRYWFATVGRGLLNHLFTRLYFADEPANAEDPILQRVPPERRGTLVAAREEASGAVIYRLDIVLQGPGETVFFNLGGV
jgi:protocatechuate 3,4-dioxygenase alpha subunit